MLSWSNNDVAQSARALWVTHRQAGADRQARVNHGAQAGLDHDNAADSGSRAGPGEEFRVQVVRGGYEDGGVRAAVRQLQRLRAGGRAVDGDAMGA